MPEKKQYAILGLGRFGSKVAREIFYRGHEVIAVDSDEQKIQSIKDEVTHAFIGDISDEAVLKEAGVLECDVVIVAESSNVESNIIAAQVCKSAGVKQVICKAKNTIHGKILQKIQADIIIFPEQDTAIKLVNKLTSEGVLDYFEIGENMHIVSVKSPAWMVNKTLQELDLRHRYFVTIMAIKRGEETLVVPSGETPILEDDILICFGRAESLKKLHVDVGHKT